MRQPGAGAMTRRPAFICALVVLACAGCGAPSAAQRARARRIDGALLLGEVQARSRAAADAEAEAARTECMTQIGDFMKRLEDLNSRLGVGLTFQNYSDKLGDVSVAYGRIDVSQLNPGKCLDAAADAETAMNAYTRANNTWNACISDLNCSTDSIDPKLQKQWSLASGKIERARNELDLLGSTGQIPAYSNQVPVFASDVDTTVYGGARKFICRDPTLKPAAKEPCARLTDVLTNGVSDAELKELDSAVSDLDVALGLKAPEQ
jgi:hypothetical protein